MKFRKKPVVIEATQWFTHGDHPAVAPVPYDHPVDGFAIKPGEWGWIRTLESPGHLVQPGDWIVTGVQGEHYAVKPDIFAATYDPEPDPAVPNRSEDPRLFTRVDSESSSSSDRAQTPEPSR